MPVLDFEDPNTGRVISVMVRITEPTENFHTQVEDGVTYKRVYSAPLAAQNSIMKSGSREEFTKLTENKKGMKVGDLWEISKQMAEVRAEQNGGVDPVSEKFYEKHKEETGNEHPDVLRRQTEAAKEKLYKEFGVKLT